MSQFSIRTAKGRPLNLLDPKPADIDIEEIAISLSNLCRFNGHTYLFYSIAQHNIIVSSFLPFEMQPYGLLYNAHVAYLGPLTPPVQRVLHYQIGKHAWAELIVRLDTVIFKALGLTYPMPDDIAERVNLASLVALSTEARDVLAPGKVEFGGLPKPCSRRIRPCSSFVAVDRFMEKARGMPQIKFPHSSFEVTPDRDTSHIPVPDLTGVF